MATSQRHTHIHTHSLTKGRHPSTSGLHSGPRPCVRCCIKEGEARLAPRRPQSAAPSSIQSSLPDKLMETNQLSGRTRRTLHLPASRTTPPPAPLLHSSSLPPPPPPNSSPTIISAITVRSRNNRVMAIYIVSGLLPGLEHTYHTNTRRIFPGHINLPFLLILTSMTSIAF